MRKFVLLSLVLLLGLIVGCGGEATPSPSPSPLPASPTPAPEIATAAPSVTESPSGPATCEVFSFLVEDRIPPLTDEDHAHGPADASIAFIEYADFQCPACAALATLRVYLEDTYGEDIRIAYRHLPLISIHDKAVITAEAAEGAGAQDKFWEMHDLLYEKQQEWGRLAEDELETKLVEYAEELGLDAERFAQELGDHVYREGIMAGYEAYSQYGQMATPTYVVNNVFYPTQQFGGFGGMDSFINFIELSDQMYTEPPPQVIDADKDYVATLRTSKGDIVVELFAEQSPRNVNSFVFLAQNGWYDELDFFYVEPNAVALSGDPTNSGGGLPYAGYYCGDETSPDLTFDQAGVLALYTASLGRNGSSFFITYAPQPDFDGQFTIIGRVIEGLEVAESLTPTQPGDDEAQPDILETILIEEG